MTENDSFKKIREEIQSLKLSLESEIKKNSDDKIVLENENKGFRTEIGKLNSDIGKLNSEIQGLENENQLLEEDIEDLNIRLSIIEDSKIIREVIKYFMQIIRIIYDQPNDRREKDILDELKQRLNTERSISCLNLFGRLLNKKNECNRLFHTNGVTLDEHFWKKFSNNVVCNSDEHIIIKNMFETLNDGSQMVKSDINEYNFSGNKFLIKKKFEAFLI